MRQLKVNWQAMTDDQKTAFRHNNPTVDFSPLDTYDMAADFNANNHGAVAWTRDVQRPADPVAYVAPAIGPAPNAAAQHPADPNAANPNAADPHAAEPNNAGGPNQPAPAPGMAFAPRDGFQYRSGDTAPYTHAQIRGYNEFIQYLVNNEPALHQYDSDKEGNYEAVRSSSTGTYHAEPCK
jgi:hypothetical protein